MQELCINPACLQGAADLIEYPQGGPPPPCQIGAMQFEEMHSGLSVCTSGMPAGWVKNVQGDVCLDRAQTLADLCRIGQNLDLPSPDWYLKPDLLPKRRQDVSAKSTLQTY